MSIDFFAITYISNFNWLEITLPEIQTQQIKSIQTCRWPCLFMSCLNRFTSAEFEFPVI